MRGSIDAAGQSGDHDIAGIAQVLGHVSIHCPMPAVDGRLVGQFAQQIHRGWYSNVETEREGTHMVEAQVGAGPNGRPIYDAPLRVSWSAREPGEAVRCTVEPVTFTEVTVEVRDPSGLPLVGAKVFGCGVHGVTGADGVLVARAYDHARCEVRAYRRGTVGSYALPFDPAGSVRRLRLLPEVQEPSDYDPRRSAAESREILEIYEGLAPLASTPEATELFAHLIAHRTSMLDLYACQLGDTQACARSRSRSG